MWGKRKNYMITFWTHEYPKELPDNSTYLCTCEDTCENGRYHGHAFIYFKNPEDMKCVKSLFGHNAHLEVPRRNSWCIRYILNNNTRKHDFQEFGERPLD